jgi:cytochrome P450
LLRYDGPLETATERFTREKVSVAGVTIPQGEMVVAALGSANRDERQFQSPETLDLARQDNKPVGSGFGAH